MVYNQTLTIWDLPPRPLLPINDIKDPVFVTIWLVVCVIAAFYLRALLKREQNPTWQEFRAVRYGTLGLATWYIAITTDRWLRYESTSLPVEYGYALAEPMFETLRVTSTILILWGTYTVVWKELEDQFSPKQQGIWWFAARSLLFIVTLMAIFYVVLGVALSVVWLQFFSLNAIADIAGKRNDFEMAMTAFFFLFSLLTLIEATVVWFNAFRVHGHVQRTRLFLWLAALFLFVRSTAELAIVNDLYKFKATRHHMKFTSDVSYGFITMLYLVMMCVMATLVASTFDSGGRQAKMVASDVRYYIVNMLEAVTNGSRKESPPFETILREVERNLESVLSRGPLTGTLDINYAYKEAAARDCIEQLRTEFGKLDPKEGDDYTSRPPSTLSVLTALFGRRSRQSMNMSSTTLNTNTNRPQPSNASAITGSTAVSRPAPEQPRGMGRTASLYSDAPSAPFPGLPPPVNAAPAAGSSFTTSNNGLPRWAPSLSPYQEQPQPYQDIVPLPFVQPDMSTSPPPGPPPIARRSINSHSPPIAPATQSTTLQPLDPPVAPRAASVPTTPYNLNYTNNSSPAVSMSPTPGLGNQSYNVPISQSTEANYSPAGADSRVSGSNSSNAPTPQPVPLPSSPGTSVRGNGPPILPWSSSVIASPSSQQVATQGLPAFDGQMSSNSNPNPHTAQHPQPQPPKTNTNTTTPLSSLSTSRYSQATAAQNITLSSTSASASATTRRPNPQPPTGPSSSSSSSNRNSTSPQATAGSSYRFLQAQRVFGGGGGGSDPSSSSASTPGTGYQVRPANNRPSAPATMSGAAGLSTNTPTAGGLGPQIAAVSGATRTTGALSSHARASPVPVRVPQPTPPPPRRPLFSADAYDERSRETEQYMSRYHSSE